jgi:hypothetical protein
MLVSLSRWCRRLHTDPRWEVYPIYVQSVASDLAPHGQTDGRVYPQSLFDDHLEIRKLLRLLEGGALVTRHALRLDFDLPAARHILRCEHTIQRLSKKCSSYRYRQPHSRPMPSSPADTSRSLRYLPRVDVQVSPGKCLPRSSLRCQHQLFRDRVCPRTL